MAEKSPKNPLLWKKFTKDEIEEKQKQVRPAYGGRARKIAMNFGYFDRDLEVYSETEGVDKNINGQIIGINHWNRKDRQAKTFDEEEEEKERQEILA